MPLPRVTASSIFGIMFVVLGALLLQARMLPRWHAWAAIIRSLVQFACEHPMAAGAELVVELD
ncbi:hypothetical protein [Homoserinimonas sp. A520]